MGQIRRYNGALYKCVQDHTSQAEWTPDTASSLWAGTSDPAEEWPAWSQPVGAHDAYSSGAKVSHNGKHWISSVDNNVWEPVCMDGRSRRNKCGRTQQLYCKETRPLQCLRYPDKYPVGHSFDGAGGLYLLGEQPLCTVTSQIAFDYFTQDDDGKGQERGVLLESIIARLCLRMSEMIVSAVGTACGTIRCAKSTEGRSMRISGSGTMSFSMRRWRICGISPI